MALGTTPLFKELSGSVGPMDFRTRRNGKIEIGKKRIPTNTQSSRQLEVRAGYGRLHELWQNASYTDKAQYERLGKLYNVSPWNAFLMRHQSAMSAAPVASWGFVESSGTNLHDLTTNENLGTISGATWETSKIADLSYLSFDRIDDFINAGPVVPLGETTVMMWFKTTYTGILNALISFSGTAANALFSFSLIDARPFLFLGASNSAFFDSSVVKFYDGKWHFLCLYIAGSAQTDITNATLSIDLENIPIHTVLFSGAPDPWGDFYIGKNALSLFKGSISNTSIFNYDASQTTANLIYTSTKKLYGVYP